MIQIGNEQSYHDPMLCGTNDLQELSKPHDIVSRSKTELWHRVLTHYLPLFFPEAERFHRSSRSDWFFVFLERSPSPHFISAMDRQSFIADAWEVVGRKVSKERLLADIYETAKTSVGIHLLQAPVFLDHRLHLRHQGRIHAAIFETSVVVYRVADPMIPAKVGNRHTAFTLL